MNFNSWALAPKALGAGRSTPGTRLGYRAQTTRVAPPPGLKRYSLRSPSGLLFWRPACLLLASSWSPPSVLLMSSQHPPGVLLESSGRPPGVLLASCSGVLPWRPPALRPPAWRPPAVRATVWLQRFRAIHCGTLRFWHLLASYWDPVHAGARICTHTYA